jgi:type I restriction enzyme M protein
MENKSPSPDEINRIAWAACDTFRGVVDADQYKNYILVMLFIKYISDKWKEKKEQFEKQYKDPERVRRALKRERFIVPEESAFDFLYENRNRNNIGELINKATAALEEENPGKLEDVFRGIDYNSEHNLGDQKEKNRRLKNLLEDFSNPVLDFSSSHMGSRDYIGDCYEYLIYKFASSAGKKGGEFYTPPEVSQLLATLVEPKPGNKIYDPTCGSGSLLIKVAHEIGSENYQLNGQESNANTYALCKMNMFLHGIDNAKIVWGDTLNSPRFTYQDALERFDIVVANPPFSLKKWWDTETSVDKYSRFLRGMPPQSKGDYAFILHMIESMNETATMAVVAPHGVLFRGSTEGKIREALIEENLLHAVIGLPANLFFGVSIPVAVLVFKKQRDTRKVLFIDGSREYHSGKNQNKLREKDIEKIFKTYKSYKSIDKYSHVASYNQIKENDFNLNIPRYVDTFVEEEEIDVNAVQKEIKMLEKELEEVKSEMDKHLKELGFKA